MKKYATAIKIAAAAAAVALLGFSMYEFYVTYVAWDNLELWALFSIILPLLCLSTVGYCALSHRFFAKLGRLKFHLVAAGAGGVGVAIIQLTTLILNVLIFKGKLAPTAARVAITLVGAYTAALLIFWVVDIWEKGKPRRIVEKTVCIVMTAAVLAGTVFTYEPYFDYSCFYPLYRLFKDIGGNECSDKDYRYDFAYSTEKIWQTDELGTDEEMRITLAKNEYEGFQLVLAAVKGGSVRVQMSDFTDAEGNTIKTTLYKEHYVYNGDRRYADTFSLYTPDALIPYGGEDVALKKNYSQAFYMETRSAADTPAGEYSAVVTVKKSDGTPLLEKTVNATVYNFTVPESPSMDTAVGIFSSLFFKLNGLKYIKSTYGINGSSVSVLYKEYQEQYKVYYDYMLDHRMSPYVLPYDILDERADAYMSDSRVTSFCVPFISSAPYYYQKIISNPVWAKKAYFYPIDEPRSETDIVVYEMMTEYLAENCPGYNMVTPFFGIEVKDEENEGETINNFDIQKGKSNISCPESICFDSSEFYEKTMERVADGDRSWWYVCCGPSAQKGYCNMFTYLQGLKHRILFWQQRQYDVTGFLYWDVAYWDKCKNPWETAKSWDDFSSSGDGCWLYPGDKIGLEGPVGSLRLTNAVDGMEDYEYFTLAEEKFGEAWVKERVARITTDLTHYTDDHALLQQVRNEIALALCE